MKNDYIIVGPTIDFPLNPRKLAPVDKYGIKEQLAILEQTPALLFKGNEWEPVAVIYKKCRKRRKVKRVD